MRRFAIFIFFSLFLCCFSYATIAAMHGKNDIWAAPDDLNCLPWAYNHQTKQCFQEVDAQLRNLIRRSGMTYVGNIQGSAFLIGKQCDQIISTKHTLNHLDGSVRGVIPASFFRNVYEANQKITAKNRRSIQIVNSKTEPLTDLNDRKISSLNMSAIDHKLHSCPIVPMLTANELKANLKKIDACLITSFNQDIANPDYKKRSTMTFQSHQGLIEVNARTRGITSCKIEGFAHDGLIETDCDAVYSASGSPFFCKVKDDEWYLVGTLVSDTCYGASNYHHCLDPNTFGQPKHETLMLPFNQKEIDRISSQ